MKGDEGLWIYASYSTLVAFFSLFGFLRSLVALFLHTRQIRSFGCASWEKSEFVKDTRARDLEYDTKVEI